MTHSYSLAGRKKRVFEHAACAGCGKPFRSERQGAKRCPSCIAAQEGAPFHRIVGDRYCEFLSRHPEADTAIDSAAVDVSVDQLDWIRRTCA